MAYTVLAAGGNAPASGYRHPAATAREALEALSKVKKLLDRAQITVEDDQGRVVGEKELRELAQQEASR